MYLFNEENRCKNILIHGIFLACFVFLIRLRSEYAAISHLSWNYWGLSDYHLLWYKAVTQDGMAAASWLGCGYSPFKSNMCFLLQCLEMSKVNV